MNYMFISLQMIETYNEFKCVWNEMNKNVRATTKITLKKLHYKLPNCIINYLIAL